MNIHTQQMKKFDEKFPHVVGDSKYFCCGEDFCDENCHEKKSSEVKSHITETEILLLEGVKEKLRERLYELEEPINMRVRLGDKLALKQLDEIKNPERMGRIYEMKSFIAFLDEQIEGIKGKK